MNIKEYSETENSENVILLEPCSFHHESKHTIVNWGDPCGKACPDCFSGACEQASGHNGPHRCSTCGKSY